MKRYAITVLALSANLALAAVASAQLPEPWHEAAIGDSRGQVDYNAAEPSFRLRGSGRLDHNSCKTFFVHREMAGDFQMTARMRPADAGDREHTGGLMLVQDLDGADKYFAHVDLRLTDRPRWVRIIKQGRHVGAYYSEDGRNWRHTPHGLGTTLQQDKVFVGMFVASAGGDGESAVVFDQVTVEPYVPEYHTAVIANSLAGTRKSTVAMNMTSMHVAPDGTCYTTSFFEEHGHCISAYRDGEDVGTGEKTSKAAAAITGVGDTGYIAFGPGFFRIDLTTQQITSNFIRVEPPAEGDHPHAPQKNYAARGLHATQDELYVANNTSDKIQVFSTDGFEKRREWDFKQPGDLALDSSGHLWVAQEGWRDSVFKGNAEPAAIYRLNRQTGEVEYKLEGVEIPNALAVGRINGAECLLVADNGDDQQVKIFSLAGDEPKLMGTVGRKGGIYADPTGAVQDAKLNGLTGVGVDDEGNIYVSTTGWPFQYRAAGIIANVTELKSFSPDAINDADAEAQWKLKSPAFIFDGGALDTETGDVSVGADERYEVEWHDNGTVDWRYAGYLANRKAFPEEFMSRRNRSAPRVRRFDGQRFLYLAGGNSLTIYRFDPDRHGETAIPAVNVRNRVASQRWPAKWPAHTPMRRKDRKFTASIWTDGAGGGKVDGIAQPEEHRMFDTLKGDTPGATWSIAPNGDLYYAGYWSQEIAHVPFEGVSADGVPMYGAPQSIPFPPLFTDVVKAMKIDPHDGMIVVGTTPKNPGHPHDIRRNWHEIQVFHDWSGEKKLHNRIELPHPGYGGGESDRSVHGVVHAGDFIFAGWRHGVVYVYDMNHGNEVIRLIPGPEANGSSGAFDNTNSALTAYKQGEEYIILAQSNENSRLLAYRWTPDTEPDHAPDVAPDVWGRTCDGKVVLEWGGRTNTIGVIRGYNVYRSVQGRDDYTKLNKELVERAHYTDQAVTNGTDYTYRVAAVNAVGEGVRSEPIALTPAAPAVSALPRDTRIGGNWKGHYGRIAYHVGYWRPERNRIPAGMDIIAPYEGSARGYDGYGPIPSDDVRLLQSDTEPGERLEHYWTDRNEPLRFHVDLKDGRPRVVSLFMSNAPDGSRVENHIQIINPIDDTVLHETSYSSDQGAEHAYLRFRIQGHVLIKVQSKSHGYVPAVRGLFVDPSA